MTKPVTIGPTQRINAAITHVIHAADDTCNNPALDNEVVLRSMLRLRGLVDAAIVNLCSHTTPAHTVAAIAAATKHNDAPGSIERKKRGGNQKSN